MRQEDYIVLTAFWTIPLRKMSIFDQIKGQTAARFTWEVLCLHGRSRIYIGPIILLNASKVFVRLRVSWTKTLNFAFIFHIDCLVAVCQPLIKLLLTYLLTYFKENKLLHGTGRYTPSGTEKPRTVPRPSVIFEIIDRRDSS